MLINVPDTDMPAIARFLAQLQGAATGSGLPASVPVAATVSDQIQTRATKRQIFREDCLLSLERQLGKGFSRYVNLSSIKQS